MSLILNLFREGSRLRYMTVISEILKEHYGAYDLKLTARELFERAESLNQLVKTGQINSVKTAESYILNSIALGLHRKSSNKVVLSPEAKALLCQHKSSQDLIGLSTPEKVILLSLLLKNDTDALLPMISFLEGHGPMTVKEMRSTDNWTQIFPHPRMKILKGAARLHRLIPRLEWCADLTLVRKAQEYEIDDAGRRLLELTKNTALHPFNDPIRLYFPDLIAKDTDQLYESFLFHLKDAYEKLSLLTPSAFYIEIAALKFLLVLAFAEEKRLLLEEQISDLLILAWKRNLKNIRLSAPSTKVHAEGVVVKDRLYSYLTLGGKKLQ